jgi:ABC-type transporter Mla subunit MlaD
MLVLINYKLKREIGSGLMNVVVVVLVVVVVVVLVVVALIEMSGYQTDNRTDQFDRLTTYDS